MISLSNFPVRSETGSFAEMGVGHRKVVSEGSEGRKRRKLENA